MSTYTVERMRKDADAIFNSAVKAVDAEECVLRFVRLEGNVLHAGDRTYSLSDYDRLLAVGAGKATPRMAAALERVLGSQLSGGIINTKYDHSEALETIETVECGHPVPDEAGVAGTQRILELLESADKRTLVIALLSGGGSALMPAPAAGITLAEKQETTRLLLGCGANIVELNVIRKHLSSVKGGGLARAAFPATVCTLMLSDVIGDPLDVIASGPTVPDTSTFGTCQGILEKFELTQAVPESVRARFAVGLAGEIEETPKPGDAALGACQNLVVGSNGLAVAAANERARELGYETLVLSTRVEGEARHVVHAYTAIAKEIAASGAPLKVPACVIAGGETVVTLQGDGKGGRNQELVLSGAMQLDGWPGVVLFSGGTDGTDGPTDAAGAVADGQTLQRARAQGLVAADFLRRNDAYNFFTPLGDLVMTGPTGTNVADVAMVLVGDEAGLPGQDQAS